MARIIAEIGSNWSSKADLVHSIETAARLGAWAVKFQRFSEYEMYGYGSRESNFHLADCSALKFLCGKHDIEFMCTAFSAAGVLEIDPYVNYHKVASSDITDLGLLEELAAIDKPVFLSTGASDHGMIMRALDVLGDSDVILMYCQSAYPSRAHDLEDIHILADRYGLPVGFSDHSIDINTPMMAIDNYGVEVIEKHVNFCGAVGPDTPHSLDTNLFADFMARIWGEDESGDEERPMYQLHNKRLVATRDLKPGDKLLFGRNFGLYRTKIPCDSPCYDPKEFQGKKVTKAIARGESLTVGV